MKKKHDVFNCLPEKHTGFKIGVGLVLFFSLLIQFPASVYGQDDRAHETEKRLKKAAAEDFEKEDYAAAYPLYSQLLSLYPRDPDYNYHFGACMLFTNADKNKAINYLEFAAKQASVDNLANYYLGRALHLNYRFNQAVRSYEKFAQQASSADLKKYPVAHLIEMCNNAKDLLASLHGLDVLRKKELNFSDFTAAYDMRANGGSLVLEPEEFKTKIDKEKKVFNFIYVTPDRTQAFFSSYGKDEKTGKDIYVVRKKADGSWGSPENLGNVINTAYDEDYPVYDARRHTLYFSSKGHNSMGGYDIFQSVYNDTLKSWGAVVNLDFPINTPDDDILFMPDTSGEIAYFSSTRSSPQGKVDVYKIIPHIQLPQTLLIAGTAYKENGKEPAACKITVKDNKTDDIVGVYTSSAEDGKYSFSLANGGSYNFTIETSNYKPQTRIVQLPVETNVNSIKEDIQFDSTGSPQIKNYPAKMPPDSDLQLVYNYMKQQAQMDVNVDTNSVQTLLAQNSGNGQKSQVGASSKNNRGNVSAESAAELEKDEQALNIKAAKAIDYASDKMEQAEQTQAEAKSILKNQQGNNNADSVAAAQNLLEQSDTLEEKGMEAYQLAVEYKNEAAGKQLEINKMGSANNQNAANNNEEISTTRVSAGDLIRMQAGQVKEDSVEVAGNNDELNQEITALQQVSQGFIIQAGQVKSPDQKIALLKQTDDLSKSKEAKKQEIKENNQELQQLHEEYNWLQSQSMKADSAFVGKESKVNKINPGVQASLQQEIDEYTAAFNYNTDSTGNEPNDSIENKIAGSNGVQNNTSKIDGASHRGKNAHRLSQTMNGIATKGKNNIQKTSGGNANDTVANNGGGVAPVANAGNSGAVGVTTPSNNGNGGGSQPVQVANNSAVAPVVNAGNSGAVGVTTPSNNNSNGGGNQPVQATNNGGSAPVANAGNSGAVGVTKSSNNNGNGGSNPPVQVANSGGGVPVVNAGNSGAAAVTTPSNNNGNGGGNQPVQVANNSAVAPVVNAGNNGAVGVTTPSNNNVNGGGNQPVQAANNGGGAPVVNAAGNSGAVGVTTPSNNVNGGVNPPVQAANNGGGVPVVNAGNNGAVGVTTPSNNNGNGGGNQPVQVTNNGGSAPAVNAGNNGAPSQIPQVININNDRQIVNAGSVSIANLQGNNNISNRQNKATSGKIVEAGGDTTSSSNSTLVSSHEKDTSKALPATPVSLANAKIKPVATSNANNNSIIENNSPITEAGNKTGDNKRKPGKTQRGSLKENINIFAETAPAYSPSNPIPINPPLPEGLIFNIQVGAYRNPIPQDLFRGFQPVIGLKGNDGYIRYSTGGYTMFDTAKNALKKIRSLGYPDAFIIAFYNGKRISIQEAFLKLGISPSPVSSPARGNENNPLVATNNNQSQIAAAPQINNIAAPLDSNELIVSGNTIIPTKKALIDERKKAQKAINDTVAPAAQSINDVKGLVFTVQVGSFAKHKGFIRLRKIKQLYTWVDEHGVIKYNSGIYNNVADAASARDIIIAHTTVKDAFVTAYYKGKRISVAEAKELLNGGVRTGNSQPGKAVSVTANDNNGGVKAPLKKPGKAIDTLTAKSSNAFALASETRVIYTVQIGSFSGELPVEMVNKILKYANEGIEPQKEENGITSYYVGEFPQYASASALQQKLLNEGFEKAVVVAYYQGKKIPVSQAQEIK